jgi:hypothetical protein
VHSKQLVHTGMQCYRYKNGSMYAICSKIKVQAIVGMIATIPSHSIYTFDRSVRSEEEK